MGSEIERLAKVAEAAEMVAEFLALLASAQAIQTAINGAG